MKFSGRMLGYTVKSHKKQGFILSLKNTILENLQEKVKGLFGSMILYFNTLDR